MWTLLGYKSFGDNMRKIKTCDITDQYVRHLMNLYFLSKYVFHIPQPEQLVKEFSDSITRDALEKVKHYDDIDIEYSFIKYSDLYIEEFFDRPEIPKGQDVYLPEAHGL